MERAGPGDTEVVRHSLTLPPGAVVKPRTVLPLRAVSESVAL